MNEVTKQPFYFIEPYAKARNLTLATLAAKLKMTDRTLRNKIARKTQFTLDESNLLATILQAPMAELFRIID